ncbi:MAG: hypothetical protein ABFC42_09230 [Sulfuricella sp.]
MIYEIPLTARPQTFSIDMAGTSFRMTLRYLNVGEGGWILDIADSNKAPIVSGIPLVTGADLLAQYRHLGFSVGLRVQTTDNPDAVPTFENLGDTGKLYFVTS